MKRLSSSSSMYASSTQVHMLQRETGQEEEHIHSHFTTVTRSKSQFSKKRNAESIQGKKKKKQMHRSREYTHSQDDYIATYCIPFINSTKTSIRYFKGLPHSNYQF